MKKAGIAIAYTIGFIIGVAIGFASTADDEDIE